MNFLLMLFKSILIFLTLFGPAAIVRAQCASGRCGMPAPAAAEWSSGNVAVAPSQGMTWSDGWFRHQDGHVELWRAGALIAHSRPGDADWDTVTSGIPDNVRTTLGLTAIGSSLPKPPKECVCKPGQCACDDCPKECLARRRHEETRTPLQEWQTHGVDQTKLAQRECYRINGIEVPKEQGLRAIGEAVIPDDSRSPRVVVLGSAGARQKVADDWSKSPNLVPFKDKAILQAYAADDWAVKDVGYTQTADPTIYVVDAGGKVLHRQEGYSGPPQLAQALRRADPDYDPKKDPDLTKGKPAGAPSSTPDPLLFGGAAAFAALGLATIARKMK
jgi:hypothetical protein